jgi:ubiquitin-protein ligase E3 A
MEETSTSVGLNEESFKQVFRAKFAALVAQGMNPTDAAAQALQELSQTNGSPEINNTPTKSIEEVKDHEEDIKMEDVQPVLNKDHVEEMEMDTEQPTTINVSSSTLPTSVATPFMAVATSKNQVPEDAQIEFQENLGVKLKQAIEVATDSNDFRLVKRQVYEIFSDLEKLNRAFKSTEAHSLKVEVLANKSWWGIDRELLQEVYGLLLSSGSTADDQQAIQNTMRNALEMLVTQPWNVCSIWTSVEDLRFFLIVFDHMMLFDPDYLNVVGGLCKMFYHLSSTAKSLLVTQWTQHFSNDELERLLQVLQQAITVNLYGAKKMDLVYAACSVLKHLYAINESRGVEGFAEYEDFYNDAVNSEVDIIQDYTHSISYQKKRHEATRTLSDRSEWMDQRMLSELSLCDFAFVLDAASKSRVLQIDSDLEQRSRMHDAIHSSLLSGEGSGIPYLVLKVRRDNLIPDAMQQLVRVSPDNLKKPLKVKFIGEEGIDEGGVKKEFFQILIRQLLDPAFGMFIYDEESRSLWFNCDSLESTMEFELIGILLGLAIYNAVILDVQFPHLVYKKLLDDPLSIKDIEIAMPQLGKGLRQLLEYPGDDVEEIYQRNFEYSYEVFGEVKTIELKPNGSTIPVTNINRQEYVDLYVDHILNKSVSKQYDAFHKGFHLVCGGEMMKTLMFRWQELQLLVCGSEEFDFEALEEATHYEDGFTESSQSIR